MQFEDRFARAIDQAARLAMRDRHVAADEIHRQLDDHTNTAESSALEECGADLRQRFGLEFWPRAVRPANAGPRGCIPGCEVAQWRGFAASIHRGTTYPRNPGTADFKRVRSVL